MIAVGVLLAVGGAGGYAVAAWMQQSVVGAAAGGSALGAGGWLQVLRSRRWLGGAALNIAAATLHAGALTVAPLVIVQPVGVLAIAVAAMLAARSSGRQLSRSAVLAIAACVAGVGLFVALSARNPVPASVTGGVEARACVIAAVLGGAFALAARRLGGRGRCLGYAAAAAVAYGLVSVLIHAGAARVQAGGIGQFSVLTVPAMVVALACGAWFVQLAYASGPPQVAVATQTVLDPLFGIGIAVVLLGEGARMGTATVAALAASGALAIAGVLGLATRRGRDEPSASRAGKPRTYPARPDPPGPAPGTDPTHDIGDRTEEVPARR